MRRPTRRRRRGRRVQVSNCLRLIIVVYAILSVFALSGWDDYSSAQAVAMIINAGVAIRLVSLVGLPYEEEDEEEDTSRPISRHTSRHTSITGGGFSEPSEDSDSPAQTHRHHD